MCLKRRPLAKLPLSCRAEFPDSAFLSGYEVETSPEFDFCPFPGDFSAPFRLIPRACTPVEMTGSSANNKCGVCGMEIEQYFEQRRFYESIRSGVIRNGKPAISRIRRSWTKALMSSGIPVFFGYEVETSPEFALYPFRNPMRELMLSKTSQKSIPEFL